MVIKIYDLPSKLLHLWTKSQGPSFHIKTMILKGHSQLWDGAGMDTTFASLKSVSLNPKSNIRIRYI